MVIYFILSHLESEEPSQKYLVAFGLKLKPKELDIKGKK